MSGNFSKIKAYIGFAQKSRSLIFGVDDILKSKKSRLILLSDNLAESSRAKLENYAKQKNIIIKVLKADDFYSLFSNESIKAVAITNENLADAINKSLAE